MTRLPLRALAAHLLTHPGDAATLARAGWRLRAAQWWRRPPFLPTPGRDYLSFRLTTALGDEGRATVADLVSAARWSLAQPRGE
jgi:hypothetical protein